jgi:hypothetical protein
MRRLIVALGLLVGVSACGSSARPLGKTAPPTTASTRADGSAIFPGLTVRLQLDAPRTVNAGTFVEGHLIVKNDTSTTISYGGCLQTTFGLLPVADPNGPLTGTAEPSCGPGQSTLAPGSSDRLFVASFVTHSPKVELPPGDYVAVVRLSDGTEYRTGITLPV